jgi:MoaA/NifB/PqqE/SkfB family radical SAM enzyme
MLDGRRAFAGPEICELDITDKCARRCRGCWTHSPSLKAPKPLHELDYSLIEQLIHELHIMGVKKIALAGRGEPFLHPRFYDILELCTRMNIKILITTSGVYIDDYFLSRFHAYTIEVIKISLWSLDRARLQLLCPGSTGDEWNMLKNVAVIGHSFPSIPQFNCIITTQNISEIGAFIEQAHQCGMRYIKLEPVQNFDEIKELALRKKDTDAFISHLPAYKRNLRRYNLKSNIDDFTRKLLFDCNNRGTYNYRASFPCFHGWTGVRILADGSIVFCCECVETAAGNITTTSFRDIWLSDTYARLRQTAVHSGCIDHRKGNINCAYGPTTMLPLMKIGATAYTAISALYGAIGNALSFNKQRS